MARPYISIGGGGPRLGVVLGRRDVLGMGKFFVGFAFVIVGMATLASAGNGNPLALLAVGIGAVVVFFVARRPYVPPMTAAEQEAAFQEAKSEFFAGTDSNQSPHVIADAKRGRWPD
jgi:hypothetical protein